MKWTPNALERIVKEMMRALEMRNYDDNEGKDDVT